MRFALVLVALLSVSAERGLPQAAPQAPIFRFHADEFWLNLHHFLYVLGRAQAKTEDSARAAVAGAPPDSWRGLATLTSDERTRWTAAIRAYSSTVSRMDAVADVPLARMTAALAAARDARSLSDPAIDPAAAAVLKGVAGIYRKAWWPSHRASNERWVASTQALVDRHGAAVLAYVTRAYGLSWPAGGYPVHLSAFANWAGAYSTTGNLLVVSTMDPASAGVQGLETLFHEAMHQWDDQMFTAVREHTRRLGKLVPRNLTHAMIFFTAGEAVRSVVPGHVPYAEAAGIWNRGMGPFKAPLQETWKPWLDGRGTREEALAALAARTAVDR